MPRRSTTSSQRRHFWVDFNFRSGTVVMRACFSCLSRNTFCVMFPSFLRCEQCVRHNRQYELDSPVDQLDKLFTQENKFLDLISESEVKTRRLRKQRRLLLKKMRDLGDREAQNIFELEVEKMMAETSPLEPLPDDLPFFSPFQVSQGSPNRIPASPLRSG